MSERNSLKAFERLNGQIEDHLTRLTDLAAERYGLNPEAINWAHVGDARRIHDLLAEAVRIAEGK